jgi:hypothetical protein
MEWYRPWCPGARALRIYCYAGLLPRIGGRAEHDYWGKRRTAVD